MKLKLIYIIMIIELYAIVGCSKDLQSKRSLEAFHSLQIALQKELKTAIKQKGPLHALSVCNIQSPHVESSMSSDEFTVRRVSLKPRNMAHAPDNVEKKVIESWMMVDQTHIPQQVIRKETKDAVYYLKPIVIQKEICLKCHGNPTNMNPLVVAKIKSLYENDQAIGYKMGDLRGAFVAKWTKN